MGFASRGGKLEQHSGISPVVDAKKCVSCGICVEKCDFGAIRISLKNFQSMLMAPQKTRKSYI
jgi:uncharacterized Fe-S center protein